MELRELTADEDVVLLGFLDEIVSADGEYSKEEHKHVAALEATLGKPRVEAALAAVNARMKSRADLEKAARGVTRVEARNAILGFLEAVAASDGLAPSEEDPLKWLAAAWK